METPPDSAVLTIKTVDELDDIARKVIAMGRRVILLQGELGAGKTALVKAFCNALGSVDEVTSPTFTLVNEYADHSGKPIFHIDLYRLETVEDALQIGIEDYLNSGGWCFIEWPGILTNLLRKGDFTKVAIEVNTDDSRRIHILK